MMVFEHDGPHSGTAGLCGRFEIIHQPVKHRRAGVTMQIARTPQKLQI
jgi:hypothetical protein